MTYDLVYLVHIITAQLNLAAVAIQVARTVHTINVNCGMQRTLYSRSKLQLQVSFVHK